MKCAIYGPGRPAKKVQREVNQHSNIDCDDPELDEVAVYYKIAILKNEDTNNHFAVIHSEARYDGEMAWHVSLDDKGIVKRCIPKKGDFYANTRKAFKMVLGKI